MTKILNAVVLAAAATAVIAASPASARTRHHAAPRVETMQSYEAANGSAGYVVNDPYVVTDGTHYLGRDPDLQIRSSILKDESAATGTN